MKITNFTLGSCDSDGTISSEATIKFVNPTKEVVRLVTLKSVLRGPLGSLLTSYANDDVECMMDPQDSHNAVVGVIGSSVELEGLHPSQVQFMAFATLHARDFIKLGEVDVPKAAHGWTTLERAIQSRTLESPVRILVRRGEDSDDRTTELEWSASLRNIAEFRLDHVRLKCELVDADGDIVATSNDSAQFEAGHVGLVSDSFSSVHIGQLRGAKLQFTMSLFRPVYNEIISGSATASEE